jgi:four helix bundle protein
MTPKELKDRTGRFAVDVVHLTRELPNTLDGRRIGQQFLDAGTSAAANYRSACRPRSHAEFIAKLGNVEEESDETLFWLELMVDSRLVTLRRVEKLLKPPIDDRRLIRNPLDPQSAIVAVSLPTDAAASLR